MSNNKKISVLEETVHVQWMQEEDFNRVEFEAVNNEPGHKLTKINYRIHHGCKWPRNSGRLSIE